MKTYIINRDGDSKDDRNKGAGLRITVPVLLFWLAVWQAAAMIVHKPLLLPDPAETAAALAAMAGKAEFYLNIGWTFFRCMVSMALSFLLGAAASAAAYRFSAVRHLLSLPVGFFKAVPVMAIIIYVILIAEADWVAIIVCFLMCFPIVYTNILAGLDSMGNELKEMACVYKLNDVQKVIYIYGPSVKPQINSALRLICGLSWKAVVAAEVLSIPKYSIGYEMINSKYYLQTPTLMAYILVVVVLSIGIERLMNIFLEKSDAGDYRGSRLKRELGKAARRNSREAKIPDVEAASPAIEMRDLHKSYYSKQVIDHVDMTFKGGETTVLVGPSGIGKTTLARVISGLEAPDSGSLVIGGHMELSYLFQEDRLLPWLNVYDNMSIGLLKSGGLPDDISLKDDPVIKMAEALEISDSLWKLPRQLSGGMRHRAALGRTFLARANVMILDEPFRGLDAPLRSRIIDRLWQKETESKTVIVITHEPGIFREKTIKMK